MHSVMHRKPVVVHTQPSRAYLVRVLWGRALHTALSAHQPLLYSSQAVKLGPGLSKGS